MAKEDKRQKVLFDHVQKGKRFIPPMLRLTAPLSEVRWANFMLPEMLWLGLLIRRYNYLKGAELGLLFSLTAMNTIKENKWFGPISSYANLTDMQKEEIIKSLISSDTLDQYKEALMPLAVFYPRCPINFIFKNDDFKNICKLELLNDFKLFLTNNSSRRDRDAMLIQGSAIYNALGSDLLKICVPESELPKIPEILIDYPNSDESRRCGSEVRATLNMLLGETRDSYSTNWSDYFWNRGLELDPCNMKDLVIPMHRMEFRKGYPEILDKYIKSVDNELSERWNKWELDLSKTEMFETIGALLARQTTIGEHFISSPVFWNDQMAPIILRAMVDLYITLSWIFKDPLERSKKYIAYGLGQEKLEIEHLKTVFEDQASDCRDDEIGKIIENRLEWLNSQRWHFLTEVNVGNWAGIDTRTMAKEADCEDIYRFQFNPLSSSTHNMWHYVAKYNLQYCENPLHRFHMIPINDFGSIELEYMYQVAEWVDDTFKLFDKNTGIKVESPSAYNLLINEIDNLLKQMSNAEDR